MSKILLILFFILSFTVSVNAQQPPELVGRYQLEVDGGDILELRADGSASLAGEEIRWEADQRLIMIDGDTMHYRFSAGRLILDAGGLQLAWRRLDSAKEKKGSTAKAPAAASGKSPAQAKGADVPGNLQDSEARNLLTSSPWCSFTYNQVSGTSTTSRVIFHPDGLLTINDGRETYSSGYGGTYAGQSNTRGTMRWKVDKLRLFIDQGEGAGFEDVNLTAEKNSSGWPILHAAGREYSMCR